MCRWECISSDSSNLLLSLIRPKLVLSGWNHHMTQNSLFWLWLSLNISGHTHHGCNTSHGQGIFYFHWSRFFFMDKFFFSIFIHKIFLRSLIPPPSINVITPGVTEISISSFSWRNKVNPAFLLTTFDPLGNYEVSKCYMPNEDNVINAYIGAFILFCISLVIV